MKKTALLLAFVFSAAVVFSGCDQKQQAVDSVYLGVIETTGYQDKTYIHFFDQDLNAVKTEVNEYASLSEPFDFPIYRNGRMYAIPKGNFNQRNKSCILEYDCKADAYREHETGLKMMNSFVVSDRYAFAVNTVNAQSNLVKCDLSTGETVTKAFPDVYLSKLALFNSGLYAVSNFVKEGGTHLLRLSEDTLEIIEDYDLTSYGDPCELIEYENRIYLTNQYSDANTGGLSASITVLDRQTNRISQIDTGSNSPNNLFVRDGMLFISHFDRVQNTGNRITVMNLSTNEPRTYTFGHPVKQMKSDGAFIYVLGEGALYQYRYSDGQFTLSNQCKIDTDKSGEHFYINSFFICS